MSNIAMEFFERIRNRSKSIQEKIDMLLELMRFKDKIIYQHSINTTKYTKMLGTWLNFMPPKLKALEQASLMHDIGNLSIAGILLQLPRKLTINEFNEIQKHTTKGAELLEKRYFQ